MGNYIRHNILGKMDLPEHNNCIEHCWRYHISGWNSQDYCFIYEAEK